MLARESRLTSSRGFADTIRRGRRAATSTAVVHLSTATSGESPQVGLVVSKAVGSAVARNRVKRRLRHLIRPRLAELPSGSVLVVRALPPAAEASSAQLGRDLDRALDRALGRLRGEGER